MQFARFAVFVFVGCTSSQSPAPGSFPVTDPALTPILAPDVAPPVLDPAAPAAAPPKLDCDAGAGAPVAGPDCVTADIHCGETVTGHTRGGVNRYDTKFYERNQCWTAARNHNGGDERVYRFLFDASPMAVRDRSAAKITFDTPCADLDITSLVTRDANHCPSGSHICDTVNPFKLNNKGSRSQVITMDRGEVWYFIIEGADDAEGAFSLTLECDREH